MILGRQGDIKKYECLPAPVVIGYGCRFIKLSLNALDRLSMGKMFKITLLPRLSQREAPRATVGSTAFVELENVDSNKFGHTRESEFLGHRFGGAGVTDCDRLDVSESATARLSCFVFAACRISGKAAKLLLTKT